MSCKYCDLQIGSECRYNDSHITCEDCGHVFSISNVLIVYKFKNKGIHSFQVLDKMFCPECNLDCKKIVLPCGGSFYFDENEVSKSLVLPQEFIKRT